MENNWNHTECLKVGLNEVSCPDIKSCLNKGAENYFQVREKFELGQEKERFSFKKFTYQPKKKTDVR